MKRERIVRLIGIFFFLLGVLAIINAIDYQRPHLLFWFCYLGLLLMGIGFLRKDATLVASQINILAIPLLIWTFDFLSILFLGNPVLGITSYFFSEKSLVIKFVTLQHLFTIPLALYALSKMKIKYNDSWKLSIVQLVLVFFTTRVFTLPITNTNCVYQSCLPLQLPSYYPVFWFAISFACVFITHSMIAKSFSKKNL